jgi:hypothetical protein
MPARDVGPRSEKNCNAIRFGLLAENAVPVPICGIAARNWCNHKHFTHDPLN